MFMFHIATFVLKFVGPEIFINTFEQFTKSQQLATIYTNSRHLYKYVFIGVSFVIGNILLGTTVLYNMRYSYLCTFSFKYILDKFLHCVSVNRTISLHLNCCYLTFKKVTSDILIRHVFFFNCLLTWISTVLF